MDTVINIEQVVILFWIIKKLRTRKTTFKQSYVFLSKCSLTFSLQIKLLHGIGLYHASMYTSHNSCISCTMSVLQSISYHIELFQALTPKYTHTPHTFANFYTIF